MDKLVVCQACKRHVKERDASCPFCRNPIPTTLRGGMALVGAVTVGVSISFASCGNAVAMYGPAPYDASPPNDGAADADGGPLPAYGPPPVDGGQG